MQTSDLAKFRDLLKTFSTAMLVTHGTAGSLRARPMALVDIEPSCRMWFITSDETAKVHEIEKDTHVMVVCQHGERAHLSINGSAHLEKDRARIHQLWRESYRIWFPEGKDDARIVMIVVDPTDGEYWDHRGSNMVKYLLKSAKAYLSGQRPKDDPSEHGHLVMMP